MEYTYYNYLDDLENNLQQYYIFITGYTTQVERIMLLNLAYEYKEIFDIKKVPDVISASEVISLIDAITPDTVIQGTLDQITNTTLEQKEQLKNKLLCSLKKPTKPQYDFSSFDIPEPIEQVSPIQELVTTWDDEADIDDKVVKVLDTIFKPLKELK